MSLTTTEIGNVCLVCDAQRCSEALVSAVSQADVLTTARAGRWFVGTLHFCDRHAYLGALANPTQTNAQLAAAYAAAIAAPDPTTAATLKAELIARGAADQPIAAATGTSDGISATVLTTNGDILTRAAGVPARITRANLAADAAFTGAFATAAQGATADAASTTAGLAVPKATLTTDGDILTRAAGVVARITRANLAADAAFTAAFLAAGTGLRRFSTGRYYTSDHYGNDSTVTPTVGTLIVAPFPVGITTAFDRITLEVTATFAAAEHRLGIYNDTGTGLPGTVLLDAGVIDTHTANGVISITINQTLTPGLYWLGSVAQTAATSATVRGRTAIPSLYIGQSSGGNANVNGYSRTGVAGALPTFGAVSDYQAVMPKVMLRAT